MKGRPSKVWRPSLDVGAVLTTALAGPVGKVVGSTPEEVQEIVAREPRTVYDLLLSSIMRAVAWFLFAGVALALYMAGTLVEAALYGWGQSTFRDWAGLPAITAAMVGFVTGLRVGVTYYGDSLWERGGAVVRWVLAPGNKDVALGIGVTLLSAVSVTL